MDYPLLPPEGVLYEVGKYARSVRLRRTAPLLFVFSGSLCFRRKMRSKAALPLAQYGSAALSRALVVSLCLRELTSLPTLLESADYREGCFSVRFPFSLGVSTTPRAGRVGAPRLRAVRSCPNKCSADARSAQSLLTNDTRTSGRLKTFSMASWTPWGH